MDRREAERFVAALRDARSAGIPAAIATVVRVRGSAYRREGTRMLVRQDGTFECALSGGCLEPAVVEAASRVIETGQPTVAVYDLADDSPWGLNLGCGGAVDIRIEPVLDDPLTDAWLDVLDRGEAAVLMTPISGVSGQRILLASGMTLGELDDPAIELEADVRARDWLHSPAPQSGIRDVGGAEIFFDISLPAPELVIFGAGHDAEPLSRQARALGFDVTIVDSRDAYLQSSRFPGARLVSAPFDRLAGAVTLHRDSYVVVMSHHVERDREALHFSLAARPAYIGVLGPRARFQQVAQGLRREENVRDGALARVRSPIGLSLGAETPEEVAVSILAEILAVRHGFDAGFLSGTEGRLHRPLDTRVTARS